MKILQRCMWKPINMNPKMTKARKKCLNKTIRRKIPVHTHTLPPDIAQNSVGINDLMISFKNLDHYVFWYT